MVLRPFRWSRPAPPPEPVERLLTAATIDELIDAWETCIARGIMPHHPIRPATGGPPTLHDAFDARVAEIRWGRTPCRARERSAPPGDACRLARG